MMTVANLEAKFPFIAWREPVRVAWATTPPRQTFACRVCIANYGLNAKSSWQWSTAAEADAHIEDRHK